MIISVAQNNTLETSRGWAEEHRSLIYFRRRNFCVFNSRETSANIVHNEGGIQTSNILNTSNQKTPLRYFVVDGVGAADRVQGVSALAQQATRRSLPSGSRGERVYCRPRGAARDGGGVGALSSPTEHAGTTRRSVIFHSSFGIIASLPALPCQLPCFLHILSFSVFILWLSTTHFFFCCIFYSVVSSATPVFTLRLPVVFLSSFNVIRIFTFFRVNN